MNKQERRWVTTGIIFIALGLVWCGSIAAWKLFFSDWTFVDGAIAMLNIACGFSMASSGIDIIRTAYRSRDRRLIHEAKSTS